MDTLCIKRYGTLVVAKSYREPGNPHDPFAVNIVRSSVTVSLNCSTSNFIGLLALPSTGRIDPLSNNLRTYYHVLVSYPDYTRYRTQTTNWRVKFSKS